MARNPVVVAAVIPVMWVYAMVTLPYLADFPSTLLALLLVLVIPGFVLLSLAPGRWTLPEVAVISLLLGCGQAAVVAVPPLLLHLPLVTVVLAHVVVTTILVGLAVRRPRLEIEFSRLGAAVVGLVVVAIVITSITSGDKLARGGDSWRLLPYTSSYVAGDGLNEQNASIGSDVDVTARLLFNVLSVDQAMLSAVGEIDPADLALDHFQVVATFLGALATFALASRLAGSEKAGAFAVIFLAVLVITDLQAHEGYGRSFLIRGGEDKFFASFVLFPAFGLLVLDHQGGRLHAALLILGALAISLMHPFGAVFVALALAAMAVGAYLSKEPDLKDRIGTSLLVLFVVGLPALFQRFGYDNSADDIFSGSNRFRIDERRLDLPGPLVALNPSTLSHPLLWAAILVAPFVIWRVKDGRVRALVAMLLLVLPAILFFPITATILGKVAGPGLLWRFLHIIPFAAVLGVAFSRLPLRSYAQGAALGAAAIASIGGVELMGDLNKEYYTNSIAGGGDSVVLSGIDNAWDPGNYWVELRHRNVRQLAARIDGMIEGDAVVLVPPAIAIGELQGPLYLDMALPTFHPELKSFTNGPIFDDTPSVIGSLTEKGRGGGGGRYAFSRLFYRNGGGFPPSLSLDALLADKPITHVMVEKDKYLARRMDSNPRFERLGEIFRNFVLYAIHPEPLEEAQAGAE